MSKKKKTYSAEFKSKVVLELLSEEQTIAQIASKYEISAKSLIDWKKQFLDNASLVFDRVQKGARNKRLRATY